MRRIGVSVLLVLLLATLVGFVVHRHVALPGAGPEDASAEGSDDGAPTDGSASGGEASEGTSEVDEHGSEPATESGSATSATGTEPATESGSTEAAPATTETGTAETPSGQGAEPTPSDEGTTAPPTPPPLDRPLRVVSTSWEVATPVLLAAGGSSTIDGSILSREQLAVEVRVSTRTTELEEALARGGSEANGADVAIVPLATWVGSYEHLAALETEVFFVAAWSRGSEVLFASPSATPAERVPASFAIAGTRGAPESLTALLLLSEMGVAPDHVRFTASDDLDALLATAEREGPDAELRARNRVPWLSTADASHLAPWVIVAPRGFVRAHQPALVALSSAWLEGMAQLASDVPGAARTIAAIPGAPPLVDLLRRLGQIESIGLREQAELAGLSGRSYVTLETLFRRAWSIERAIGVLSGPPPETLPIATGTIASLVRREVPAPVEHPPFRAAPEPRVIVTVPLALPRSSRDAAAGDAIVAHIGFAAGVFPRSGLRLVGPRDRSAALRALADRAIEQYGLDASRLEITTGTSAALRVLAPE